jgi:hypothetical protein
MNLSVSTLFFELALIFIPGFVWMKIHSRYGFKGAKTQFDLILNAFIFGVLSYTFLYIIYRYNNWPLKLFDLDVDSKRLLQPELFPEILLAVAISIICGVLPLYFENHKLFTRFVQTIGATKTYGDEDVWDFVFNSSSSAVDFVHFRDFEQRVTYAWLCRSFLRKRAIARNRSAGGDSSSPLSCQSARGYPYRVSTQLLKGALGERKAEISPGRLQSLKSAE